MLSYYPAKLLLFGEYTVLSGSQALAVPLHQWSGRWERQDKANTKEEAPIKDYVVWLEANEIISPEIASEILQEAGNGLSYLADIPIGFGLGSSGAYVAAIYDRYVKKNTEDSLTTHAMLAKMESYFHGSSSGMDPLVSYSKKALYKSETGELLTINDPGWPDPYKVYLLDSGIARSTGSLVKSYREMLAEDDFKWRISSELIPMVEHGIHFYLSGSAQKLEECLDIICDFQRKYFSSFIPADIKNQWDMLRKNSGVFIKFCGAGGGGYFLVITTPTFKGEVPANCISINQDQKPF